MNSFAVLALLGATSATTGPLPAKTASPLVWPKYTGTITAPTGSDLDVLRYKAAWTGDTMYKCFRSGYFAFPTQTLSNDLADPLVTGARTTITGAASGTRTFWATTYAMVGSANGQFDGSFASGTTAATIVAQKANGTSQQCCPIAGTNTIGYGVTCNSGIGWTLNSGTEESRGITNRVMLRPDTSADTTMGATTALVVNSKWNNDIVLASMAHFADAAGTTSYNTDGAAGKAYCSPFLNSLLKDGTEVAIQAANGLVAGTKCTWQMVAADESVGPAFKINSTDEGDLLVQWMEWLDKTHLPTDYALPAASVADHYLGAYVLTEGIWLNPQITVQTGAGAAFKAVTYVWGHKLDDPTMAVPGEIGNAVYYPDVDGPYKATQTITTSARELMNDYASLASVYSSFDSDASAYNTLKTAYNEANKAEKDRDADFGKWLFEPVTKIPQRPCKPSTPPAWWGTTLVLGSAFGTGSTAFSGQKNTKNAYLRWTNTASPNVASEAVDNKRANGYGYLTIGDTTTASAVVTTNVGKTFGILGEGKTAMYDNQAPFFWGEVTAGNTATIMLSLFPDQQTTTGLTAAAKTVSITAKALTWATMDSTKAPTQPSGLADPDAEWNNASALGASILAASAVIATLA